MSLSMHIYNAAAMQQLCKIKIQLICHTLHVKNASKYAIVAQKCINCLNKYYAIIVVLVSYCIAPSTKKNAILWITKVLSLLLLLLIKIY